MREDRLYTEMLEALYATFGDHGSFRITHAKGVLVQGSFVADAGARAITRATHMQGDVVPVTLRFSNFSGVPGTPDADPMANPRGLALRFHLPGGDQTDIVAHSHNGFPAATPEEFLAFLKAIAASIGDPTDEGGLAGFLADHPRAAAYLSAPKPTPQSYAAISYFGINAFQFTNQHGQSCIGRYRIDPLGSLSLARRDEDLATLEPDFLANELRSRLSKEPIRMKLILQLARPDDDVTDGSVPWPSGGSEAREEVLLGIVTIKAFAKGLGESDIAFNPSRLIDGVASSTDPMIAVRGRLYELAANRRSEKPNLPKFGK